MLFSEDDYIFELETIVEDFQKKLDEINVGKPSVNIFNNIKVTAYETVMPISGVARIALSGDSILLTVFDKGNLLLVEEALKKADLNASIAVEGGDTIRVKFRLMTEEDRLAKKDGLSKMEEVYLNEARGVRRNYNDKVKSLDKVSEDDVKRDLERIQELLKKYEEQMDKMSADKEKELMTI